MDKTAFLLLHGYGGSHPLHWQSVLAKKLTEKDQRVIYPDFPQPDQPRLEIWMDYLEDQLKNLKDDLVVAAHSLGCAIWLHYAAQHPETRPRQVFLVSPPLNDCDIEEISDFFPLPELDLSDQPYQMIGSDNDHFIPESDFHILSEKLKVPLKILPDAGHINAPMHGDWEWINEEIFKLLNQKSQI